MKKVVLNPFINFLILEGDFLISNIFSRKVLKIKNVNNDFIDFIQFIHTRFNDNKLHCFDEIEFELNKKFKDERVASKLAKLSIDIDLFSSAPVLIKGAKLINRNKLLGNFYRYNSIQYNLEYLDYNDLNVHNIDHKKMLDYLQKDMPPSVECGDVDDSFYQLHYPTSPFKEKNLIDLVIYYAFGAQKKGKFLELLDVLVKSVPSKGARCGFDLLYSGTNNYNGLYPLTSNWIYLPTKHRFAKLNDKYDFLKLKDDSFWIICKFDRYQWRYRDSWSYKDIYLDLGHIIEMLKLCVMQFGLKIKFINCDEKVIEKSLNEEIVLGFQLEIE